MIQREKIELCSRCDLCQFRGNKTELDKHISPRHAVTSTCEECGNVFPDVKERVQCKMILHQKLP